MSETLSLELLESSKSVLRKGAQAYYSPLEASRFLHALAGDVPALDLTAGDGSLLQAWPKQHRFGVEIDPRVSKPYTAITGDVQQVFPLLLRAGASFAFAALNPPFGLTWEDATFADKSLSSTKLSYLYALQLLTAQGHGGLIAGRERIAREILSCPEGRHIYALIHCPDLFPDIELPISIALFAKPYSGPLEERTVARADLPEIDPYSFEFCADSVPDADEQAAHLKEIFAAVQQEYHRRRASKSKSKREKAPAFTIRLEHGKLAVSLNAFTQLALANAHGPQAVEELRRLHRQPPSFFGLERAEWRRLRDWQAQGLITIEPQAQEAVEAAILEVRALASPLFPVKPAQRLGFLEDLDRIRCIKSDEERGYVAGESYPISSSTKLISEQGFAWKTDKQTGEREPVEVLREWKVLDININGQRFSESKDEIEYLLAHFEIPDPPTVAQLRPQEYTQMQRLLAAIESVLKFKLRKFQYEAIALLLLKGRGLLSFSPGLGKTPSALAFAAAQTLLPRFRALTPHLREQAAIPTLAKALFGGRPRPRVLIVAPQGLIPQWQREAHKFLKIKLTEIHNVADARALKRQRSFWAITHYEALSRIGAVEELYPEAEVLRVLTNEGETRVLTTKHLCPKCRARQGWNGKKCAECGYSHIKHRAKAAYAHLPQVKVLIIDEIHQAKSDNALRSLALRAIRAEAKLGLSGTPMKEFAHDLFWPMWVCLGNNSPLFPFSYQDKPKFVDEFCVKRYRLNKRGKKDGSPVVEPRIANISKLWRILCTNTIPMSLQDCGEPLVPYTKEVVRAPFGTAQLQVYQNWLLNFGEYYKKRHPQSRLSPEMIERMGMMLGQGVRLQFACTLPAQNPEWTSSNFTPKNVALLEKTCELVAQGKQVVIFSNRMQAGPWLAARLQERGIKAAHTVGPDGQTQAPRQRTRTIAAFKAGEYQVLCGGVDSMGEGHDLVEASCLMLNGIGWSHSSLVQALARVRRLTSQQPIRVFIYLVAGSIEDEEIWQRIKDKESSSHLAFYGELRLDEEAETDLQAILEIHKRTFVGQHATIDEAQLEQQWRIALRART